MFHLFILLISLNGFAEGATIVRAAAGCTIDPNDDSFPSPDPLLLKPNASYEQVTDYQQGFYVPDSKTGILSLAEGDKIWLSCPGPNNTLSFTKTSDEIATCIGNNQFQIRNLQPTTLSKLNCQQSPYNNAVRRDMCYQNQVGVDIGFNLTRFYPLIYVCFDEENLSTIYSHEILPASIKGYESGADRPGFLEGDFYPDESMNSVYAYTNQLDVFEKLLGSAELAKYYLKDQSQYFLARGHFAPRADFIYATHNRATFYYINAGPQWQIFNGGVWNSLELATRDFAIDNLVDLLVYTGPHGVLAYPDVNNNKVDLYLINAGTNNQKLPISKFYWKVVYEPKSKAGVAFVGINDPFVANPLPDDYRLCPDVLDQISWFNPSDKHLIYACNVNDFRAVVDKLPTIEVDNLLT